MKLDPNIVKTIRELLISGRSINSIAREFKVAKSTVSYHAKKLGLGKPVNLNPVNWEDVQAYHDAGNSLTACRKFFKFSQDRLKTALKRGILTEREFIKQTKDEYRAKNRAYNLNKYKKKMAAAIERLDPETKSFSLGSHWSVTDEVWESELAKCQVLCFSCHNIKTIKDNNWNDGKRSHGNTSSYKYCKCHPCKMAKSIANKDFAGRKALGLVIPRPRRNKNK